MLNVRMPLALLAGFVLVACDMPQGRPVPQPSGATLYRTYCASCHGENAEGKGPVAPLMAVTVPDLTRIAVRRGGTFPDAEIYRIIDGQASLPAHGDRHMPVWGYEFFGGEGDDRLAHQQATQRVERLLDYLRTIQRAP